MNYKHSCVIGADESYQTLVLVITEPDESGRLRESVQHYTLAEEAAFSKKQAN